MVVYHTSKGVKVYSVHCTSAINRTSATNKILSHRVDNSKHRVEKVFQFTIEAWELNSNSLLIRKKYVLVPMLGLRKKYFCS